MPENALVKKLYDEADRRQQMADYAVAHDLRAHARAVSTAEQALKGSKEVRPHIKLKKGAMP